MKNLGSCCFIFVALILSSNASTSFECSYETFSDYPHEGSLYFCKLKNLPKINEPNTKLSAPLGTHSTGKSNANVEGFYVASSSYLVNYFPQGLGDYFPNLKSLRTDSVQMKEIHQNDLQPFTELEVFLFHYNKIEYIEKDLFKYNTKLKVIAIRYSGLSYIEPTVFDHLNSLKELHLNSDNICIDENSQTRQGVLELIKKVKEKCSDPKDYLEKVLSPIQKTVFENLKKEIADSRKESEKVIIDKINELQTHHENKMENMSAKFEALKEDKVDNNSFDETVMSHSISIFIAIPVICLLTLLNVGLFIVCLRNKINLRATLAAPAVQIEFKTSTKQFN